MDQRQAVSGVAACTAQAAHRRDHAHRDRAQCCHPHQVEVVHLGRDAMAVCHDCGTDTGFLPERDAERVAGDHRRETLAVSVPLPRAKAS